ncbi:MAG: hypothetical protein PHO88_06985, partial [Clostridia bacterium]|nr:hypothetical protein [Clostridia bacterium]
MQVIIDERVDKNIERYFLELGYEVNKVKKHEGIYNEISSHTDIFAVKIEDTVISSSNAFSNNVSGKYNWIFGDNVGKVYPDTAKYNVCIVDKNAIHNFKITDKVVLQ